MDLIRGTHNLKQQNGTVVTIGNFDGMHIGHKAIVSRLLDVAKTLGLPSVLISFMPTPQSFFGNPQAALSSFKEKHRSLAAMGLDMHLIIGFNAAFSQLSAQDFVRTILLDKLAMKCCLVGDDFRFGKGREGDFALLENLAKTHNFALEKTPSILVAGSRVSSSKIRGYLQQGDMRSAAQMLGYEFSISGTIIHGLKNGRRLGFPTINLPIKREISPIYGVFAVVVKLQGKSYQGVCSLGNRPIIGGLKTLLEVFLFDFEAQVYGLEAITIFKHKLRDERNFDDFKALSKQIETDVADAKNYFA